MKQKIVIMAGYTIKDLEKLSGIKAHTIRIWEKRYRIIEPDRTDTNRRRYSDNDLRKILNISILNRNGLKISNIARLTEEQIRERVTLITQEISKSDTQIEALLLAMLDFNQSGFNSILTKSIVKLGLENSFERVVFPFLIRIGILWQTASLNTAQEHFVSNLIRQKLITGIASLSSDKEELKRVLFYLPENEAHELALLFYAYIVKQLGFEILYLGQLTPLDSVKYSIDKWKPDFIITGMLSTFAGIDAKEYIHNLASLAGKTTFIVSGLLATVEMEKIPSNIHRIQSVDQLKKILAS
ncbi:MAG: MerR family transcriptional regulator [Bacteroidales bacterium]|nr:MerR family transcriptional regulator [Bacteroidales bacterium]